MDRLCGSYNEVCETVIEALQAGFETVVIATTGDNEYHVTDIHPIELKEEN